MKKLAPYISLMVLFHLAGTAIYAQETRASLALKYKHVKKIKTETSIQYRNKELDNTTTKSLVGKFEASTKWLKYIEPGISVRYKYLWSFDEEANYDQEEKIRLGVFAEIPIKLNKVILTDKVRYQYYINPKNNTKNYFRHKFKAEFNPVSSIETSISHELFYNLNSSKLDQTRIKFDVKFRLTDRYDLVGFYMVDLVQEKYISSYSITGIDIIIRL